MLRRAFGLPGMSAGPWPFTILNKKGAKVLDRKCRYAWAQMEATLVPVSHRKIGLMSIADDAQRSGNTACFCHLRERSWTGESPALEERNTAWTKHWRWRSSFCAS